MSKTGIHTEVDSSRGADSRTTVLIGVSLIAALVVLFLISTVFNSGEDGGSPVLQTASEDSTEADTTVVQTIQQPSSKPRYWLQARASSAGNAGWGQDVVAPFDTLWHLRSNAGREFFSSPALVEGVLYLGCNDGNMRAVNAGDGSILWTFSTVCGICGEPAVDSSTVYFGGQDGYVYALNRSTGARRWSAGLGYHVFCDTGIMCDSLILSGNSMGKACALSSRTGDPVWDAEIGGIVLGPVVVDTLAAYTSESGTAVVIDRNGDLIWSKDYSSQASPPSADSTAVFVAFSGGKVRKFDLNSGTVIWETDVVSTSARCVLARPVLVGNLVLVGTNDGQLICLNRSTGDIVWEQKFDNWLQLPPAVGQNLIYLACDDQRLHLIDLQTGEKVDSLEIGGYAGTAPVLCAGIIYYGNTSGDLRAIAGSLPEIEEPILPQTDSLAAVNYADSLRNPEDDESSQDSMLMDGSDLMSTSGSDSMSTPGSDSMPTPGSDSMSTPGSDSMQTSDPVEGDGD